MPLDVADPEAVEALFSSAEEERAGLTCLVNAAGIAATQVPIADYPLADWRQAINVNLNGTFYCIKYAIPLMLVSGGGAIANLSSVVDSVANATGSA